MGDRNAVAGFAPGDHDLLVKIVKETQRRGSTGTKGPWKTFLATIPRGDPSKPVQNDPARRDWQTLAAFCETLTAEEDVALVRRMREWHAWVREEERLERDDPFPPSPEQGLVTRTREHPAYKQGYDLPAYQEGWALSRRGAVSNAPQKTRLLSVDCEMCKAEGNAKELVRLSVVDQDSKVLLSEFVKLSVKVLDYQTAITGVSAKLLENVTYTHSDAQKAVLELLSEPGTILVGHGLQHDLRALKIDHRRVIDTSLIFRYEGLPTAIPALGDLCRAVLEVGFREGGAEQAHDSIEDAKIPMRLVLHEMRNGPTPPLAVPDVKVDKSELSKLFLHKIPKGTPREVLARAFEPDLGAHVQMATWGASGMGTTFAVFKNPEVANAAFKAIVGKEHKDALGRAQKSVTILPSADNADAQKVTFTVRKMGCHNGAAFGVKKKGVLAGVEAAQNGVKAGVTKTRTVEKDGKKRGKIKKEKGVKEKGVKEEAKGKGTGTEKGMEKGKGKGAETVEERVNRKGSGKAVERVNEKEGAAEGSGKKATKQGKSSAERRKARRAVERGEDKSEQAVRGNGRENSGVERGRSRVLSDRGERKASEKEAGKQNGSGKKDEKSGKKRRRESDAEGAAKRSESWEGKEKESKKRRMSKDGDRKHERRSLDGMLESREKRKRGVDGGRREKRARTSEPTATQQTLMEIQRLLASVAKDGGGQHDGTDTASRKRVKKEKGESRVGKESNGRKSSRKMDPSVRGESRRDDKDERRKEKAHRADRERVNEQRKARPVRKEDRKEKREDKRGLEGKLKHELAKRDDQLAALTKLVFEMAKAKP